MRTNRGKRPKWETKNKILPEVDLKTEEDSDEDYNVTLSANHKASTTSKKNAAVKRKKKKCVPVPQDPRRNYTRVTNKYRLRPKAVFDSSIKREDVIVIEDHFEDAKEDIKRKTRMSPMLEYEICVLVLPLTIPLSPNHRLKPPSEHLNLDRESLRKQTLG
jgi:hypothetical protein